MIATIVEAACVSPVRVASTSQPSGPLAVAETVTSWAVSFLTST